jgi:hypothetical protein
MNPSTLLLRPLRVGQSVAVLAALSLFTASLDGCAPVQSALSPPAPALALDPADPCRADREEFAKSKTYFTDEIVTGVATGAVIGALGGVALALVTHSNVGTGALIGGGAGAIGGGTTAYARVMTEKAKDQNELANNINNDLVKEGNEIDHTSATFARLRQCRFTQAQMIKQQTRRHQLDRPAALQQLAYQQDRFNEEIKLAHEYDLTMVKRSAQFSDAAAQIKQDEADAARRQAAANEAAANQAALVKVAATKSIPEKRASFDKSVTSAESSSKLAFNLDSNAKLTAILRQVSHV